MDLRPGMRVLDLAADAAPRRSLCTRELGRAGLGTDLWFDASERWPASATRASRRRVPAALRRPTAALRRTVLRRDRQHSTRSSLRPPTTCTRTTSPASSSPAGRSGLAGTAGRRFRRARPRAPRGMVGTEPGVPALTAGAPALGEQRDPRRRGGRHDARRCDAAGLAARRLPGQHDRDRRHRDRRRPPLGYFRTVGRRRPDTVLDEPSRPSPSSTCRHHFYGPTTTDSPSSSPAGKLRLFRGKTRRSRRLLPSTPPP